MKRKAFLQTTSVLLAGGLVPLPAGASEEKKKRIRFAHLSDVHVKPGLEPESGMAKAYRHVQDEKQKVDFIFNGGDMIMDALEAPKDKTRMQWDLFRRIINAENKLPVYNCIGNHDIWGWFFKENKPVDDKLYGKQWAIEMLEMPNRYYSFPKSNWEFIVLDSTQLNPAGGYIGKLDDVQYAWLEETLRAIPPEKHICIVSHIPILSISSGLFFNKTEPNGDMKIQRNLMHSDFLVLKKLFLQFPNIRCCISGHTHLQDEIEYLGIKYYCNGAVSGNWWKGPFQEFEPAYAVMELFENGESRRTIVNY
jgi:3',5'-cyclic AMP phosphodiesterase CpdA